jgi:hypothetical protein
MGGFLLEELNGTQILTQNGGRILIVLYFGDFLRLQVNDALATTSTLF